MTLKDEELLGALLLLQTCALEGAQKMLATEGFWSPKVLGTTKAPPLSVLGGGQCPP